MVAPYPDTDTRDVKELRAGLEQKVAALVPSLSRPPRKGEFGNAFYELALRMAAQVTSRLNKTAQRDALAFFDALDIPPMAPRAAEAPLVFTLTEKKDEPVIVPKGTQVGADTDKDEVIFETLHGLTVTPARLEHLVAVDAGNDVIEEAPAGVRSTEPPPGPFPQYRLATFADAGSATIQVAPVVGLEAGDLVRIAPPGGKVYRIVKIQGDLCTLEPELEASADAATVVEKITQFDAFTLRDIQAHRAYVGHSELLKLEQPARITLKIGPAGVARRLGEMQISATLYGTPVAGQVVGGQVIGSEPKPDWYPIDFEAVSGNSVSFVKSWIGKVEKFEVHDEKSLWLRLALDEKIPNRAATGTRVNTLKLKIESIPDPNAPDPNLIEGSETIERAFYNSSTPLSVGTRFLPFGPEPRRFDTFAIAAPEALSKKGATVTLHVELVDASVEALTMANIASGSPRTYAIGRDGELQAIGYDVSPLRWQQIKQPRQLPTGSASDAELQLDPAKPLQAVQIDAGSPNPLDLVIACDKGGRVWTQTIINQQPSGIFQPQGWHLIWPLTASDTALIQDLVLLKSVLSGLPTPLAISVAKDGVRLLALTSAGAAAVPAWRLLNPGTINVPALDGAPYHRCALAAVQTLDWAASPNVVTPEVVLVDGEGTTWWADLNLTNLTSAAIAWTHIFDPSTTMSLKASPEVRPAAFRSPSLFFLAAASASVTQELFALWQGSTNQKRSPPGSPITLLKDSSILCLPRHQDFAQLPAPAAGSDQPVVAAFGLQAGQITAFLWTHPMVPNDTAGRVFSTSLPANGVSTVIRKAAWVPGPNLGTDLPTLVVGGTGESILKAPLARERPNVTIIALHDVVRASSGSAPDHVELNPGTSQPVVALTPFDLVITIGLTDYYQLARSVGLAVGTPYRFLKTISSPSGIVSSSTLLTLDGTETTTWPTTTGSVLIINQAAYTVTGITFPSSNKTATLSPALPVGTTGFVNYDVTNVLLNDFANSLDIATLVELTLPPTPTPRLAGINIPGGVPAIQSIAAAQLNWLLLGAAWSTIPAPATDADLIKEFILGNWSIERLERGYQNPVLAWEYFDSRGWQPLVDSFQDGTNHLAASGDISFAVPDDLSQTDIGAQNDYWVRTTVIGGNYGNAQYVVTNTPVANPPGTTTQTITVDTSNLHPPEILSIEASFKLDKAVAPELVLVENNGAVLNQTQAAAEAQASFELFEGLLALDPKLEPRSIFLGFSKRFDVNPLTLYVDADEQEGEDALQAAVLTQQGQQAWSVVSVEDETAAFRRSGLVRISMPVAPVRASLFGRDLYWLRLAPKSAADWTPQIKGLYVNAVAAGQAKTVTQEILGSSAGEPNQVYSLSETPVILLEAAGVVREGAAAPLDVELRVRESLSDEEHRTLNDTLSRGGVKGVENSPDIPGDWVLWQRVDSFVGKDGDARIFRLDPADGTVAFGDGQQGKIPPAGADAIRAFRYQQGGGKQGNVAAYAIKNLKTALESVDAVTNPVEATGGIDTPGVEQLIATAPTRLRNANRALSGADMEALAMSSAPDVISAKYIMPGNAKGKMRLAIAVRTGQPQPRPSIARRKALAKYIIEHAAGMLEPDDLDVIPPEYAPVTVTVDLLATSADVMSEVERAARERLAALLDPIDGGPDGKGWPFGRRIWPSDIYRVVSRIAGVDRITAVTIDPDSGVDLDRLPAAALICAAENGLKVNVETGGMT